MSKNTVLNICNWICDMSIFESYPTLEWKILRKNCPAKWIIGFLVIDGEDIKYSTGKQQFLTVRIF